MPTQREFEKLVTEAPDPSEILSTINLSLDPVRWAEQTRILNGDPMSFVDRLYLVQLMRDPARIKLIHKGRQTEISEWLVNDALMFAWRYPETSVMYISDIASHAYTFSNDRVRDGAIKNSEVMQKIANPKNHTTQKLVLENGSKIRFFSAFGDFNISRSFPVDYLILDEIQSMNLTQKANIIENLAHSKHKKITAVGTGGLEGDDWEKWYLEGTEFKWNQQTKSWIPDNPLATIHSYHLPQTIVPWITPDEIAEKKRTYSPSDFLREVMGVSAKGEEVPITEKIVSFLLDQNKSFKLPNQVDRSRGPVGVSFDWGGGTKSWTIGGVYQVVNPDIPIIEAINIVPILDSDVAEQARKAINLVENYDPDFLSADVGGGTYQVQELERHFGDFFKKIQYITTLSPPWNLSEYYSKNLIKINRTFSLESLFDLMKRPAILSGHTVPRIQIPASDEQKIDYLFEHYTSLFGKETRNSSGEKIIVYDKHPDKKSDALMNLNYFNIGYNAWKNNKPTNARPKISNFGNQI